MTAVILSVVQYSTAKGIIYVELCSWWDMTHLFKKNKNNYVTTKTVFSKTNKLEKLNHLFG